MCWKRQYGMGQRLRCETSTTTNIVLPVMKPHTETIGSGIAFIAGKLAAPWSMSHIVPSAFAILIFGTAIFHTLCLVLLSRLTGLENGTIEQPPAANRLHNPQRNSTTIFIEIITFYTQMNLKLWQKISY